MILNACASMARVNTRTLIAPAALLIGAGLVAGVVRAAEIRPTGVAVPGHVPNRYITQHDNPRVYGTIPLDFDEFSRRTRSIGSEHGRFKINLMTRCNADDRYCVPVTGPIAGEWPANVWPANEGFVQGGSI